VKSAPWLFADPPTSDTAVVTLSEEESRHARVLRLEQGDEVCLTDGRGAVSRGSVTADGNRVVVTVRETRRLDRSPTQIVVYQGAAKGNKIDDLVERLAQVGVAEIHVFFSGRAVVRWDDRKRRSLTRRWEARARSAAKQSRNPWAMTAGPPMSWKGLIAAVASEPYALSLWEDADRALRDRLKAASRIALVVGPEGGFDAFEVEQLAGVRAIPVSLGPRILRTENAALVAASAILFHVGEIG
jgi:16S rRNA (uracil1498-N3)-methyltransferase